MDKIEIISRGERITHNWNIVLFTLLVLTGTVLFSIELMGWFAYIIGAPLSSLLGEEPVTIGTQLLRTSHRFIGFAWGALLTVYGLYLLIFRRVEMFRPLTKPLSQQIKEAKELTGHYVLGKPITPDVAQNLDRRDVLASYITLLLFAAVVLISFSGVALVFKEPLGLSPSMAGLMLLLHDVGFMFSLIFVAGHLFAVTHPVNRPLLNAMFDDGKIDLTWLKHHMPRYLARRGVK